MAHVDYSNTSSTATLTHRAAGVVQAGATRLVPFQNTVTLDTANIDNADDSWSLFAFPSNAILDLDSLVVGITDVDTNGTPTLDVDYGIGDGDGTIDTNLINSSTAGQSAAVERVDDSYLASNGRFLDVGGKYFEGNVAVAAATAASGTIRVSGWYLDSVDIYTAT